MEDERQINDFIEIYDNGFPERLCNDLIHWFNLCSEKGFTHHNTPLGSVESPPPVSIRSDESIAIPCDYVSSRSLPDQICQAVFQDLNVCYSEYAKKYDMVNMHLGQVFFKIHKVKPGQGYHVWHCENTHTPPSLTRVLAWMSYLKVPEEGGETEFLYQSKRIDPIVGRTLIWPAYFTHMHRGNPPLKGEKYYITGWFETI